METRFNVFEILQIAERVEHNGAKFYLKTAELLDDPEVP
jgi:rubrerythrin